MDPYVKLQGQKYNFRIVQGCFCENTKPLDFLIFLELIFY
jgi:hypothetical protein